MRSIAKTTPFLLGILLGASGALIVEVIVVIMLVREATV